MKRAIRRAARKLGVVTTYHVSATYTKKGEVSGFSQISMTCTVAPWLHVENYSELVDYVESKADNPKSTPSITSITKLGL